MRLNQKETAIIKSAILEKDPDAKIFLFGSRVDDRKRGGDIDLLVFSQTLNFTDKIKIKVAIFSRMEEQKIDLVITKDDSDPFVKIALEQSVPL